MNSQKLVVSGEGSDFHILQIHPHLPATMSRSTLAPRGINQDMPHGLRRGGEKMSTPGKSARLVSGQPQPGLVNQGCGLQGVTRSLPSHFVGGQFAQFLIDQREQFLGRLGIAVRMSFENASYVIYEE